MTLSSFFIWQELIPLYKVINNGFVFSLNMILYSLMRYLNFYNNFAGFEYNKLKDSLHDDWLILYWHFFRDSGWLQKFAGLSFGLINRKLYIATVRSRKNE